MIGVVSYHVEGGLLKVQRAIEQPMKGEADA